MDKEKLLERVAAFRMARHRYWIALVGLMVANAITSTQWGVSLLLYLPFVFAVVYLRCKDIEWSNARSVAYAMGITLLLPLSNVLPRPSEYEAYWIGFELWSTNAPLQVVGTALWWAIAVAIGYIPTPKTVQEVVEENPEEVQRLILEREGIDYDEWKKSRSGTQDGEDSQPSYRDLLTR